MLELATFVNARLPGRPGQYCLEIRQHRIQSILPMEQVVGSGADAVDVQGDWLSLGGVDLQINGALGLAFPDLIPADLPRLHKISQWLWQQGVDAYLPTLVTADAATLSQSLAVIRQYRRQVIAASPLLADPEPERVADTVADTTDGLGDRRTDLEGPALAYPLGVHLEGPFLNPQKRGAHPEQYLQPLTQARVEALVGNFVDTVRVVTLAPELDATQGAIGWLRSRHITVSLGHSLATAAEANAAFAAGASLVTHAFNAMPGLHHRQPGLLGTALVHPQVACGFIADGQHLHPTVLDLLLRVWRGSPPSQTPRLFLVSDALAPLGLPDGHYPWDTRTISVTAGTARLPDGTLAGTTLSLLAGAQNLVKWDLATPDEAIQLVTEAPRQALGLPGLGVGQPASLLRWHCQASTLSWQRLSGAKN